jgi:hypothetical protein
MILVKTIVEFNIYIYVSVPPNEEPIEINHISGRDRKKKLLEEETSAMQLLGSLSETNFLGGSTVTIEI